MTLRVGRPRQPGTFPGFMSSKPNRRFTETRGCRPNEAAVVNAAGGAYPALVFCRLESSPERMRLQSPPFISVYGFPAGAVPYINDRGTGEYFRPDSPKNPFDFASHRINSPRPRRSGDSRRKSKQKQNREIKSVHEQRRQPKQKMQNAQSFFTQRCGRRIFTLRPAR